MTWATPPEKPPTELPRSSVSPKNYAVAASMCGSIGMFGFHWFYLGRIGMGLLDLGLSLFGIALLFSGHPIWGGFVLVIDFIHSMVVTVRLLTGLEVDGEGRKIIYPGQKIGPNL